jgi:hypothetical protein
MKSTKIISICPLKIFVTFVAEIKNRVYINFYVGVLSPTKTTRLRPGFSFLVQTN